ncbi:hypothetical protein, partial [Aeromonas hydrophila]
IPERPSMAWPAAVLPCFISRFLYRPLLRDAHNAFYVQLRFLAAKTGRRRQTGRLYRVLRRFDTQGRAFTA